MTQIKTKIPAELEPAAVGGMVTDSKYVKDRVKNKTQEEVNADTEERVSTLEESVGTGGSVDERIAVEKNRAEQAEGVLDGKVAHEKQRAEGVESGLNTRLQTVEQLGSISVGGGDIGIGTAADFESDDPSDLAKVPTVGAMLGGANDGVYDISARHNGTKYADLAAALGTNGVNVPVGIRRGGMSVKFVRTSDNKYVQFRCKTQSFSLKVYDWVNEDEEIENVKGASFFYYLENQKLSNGSEQYTVNIPNWNAKKYIVIKNTTQDAGYVYYQLPNEQAATEKLVQAYSLTIAEISAVSYGETITIDNRSNRNGIFVDIYSIAKDVINSIEDILPTKQDTKVYLFKNVSFYQNTDVAYPVQVNSGVSKIVSITNKSAGDGYINIVFNRGFSFTQLVRANETITVQVPAYVKTDSITVKSLNSKVMETSLYYEISSIANEFKNMGSTAFVVVDANGRGDFTDINSAITWLNLNFDAVNTPTTIFVRNGVYIVQPSQTNPNYAAIDKGDNKISIIGESRDGVIIKCTNTATVQNKVLNIGGECTIKNLSIYCLRDDSGYTMEQDLGHNPYALHVDSGTFDNPYITLIENCYFYSECFEPIGAGLRKNQKQIYRNVVCENNGFQKFGFYCHAPQQSSWTGCSVELDGVTYISKNEGNLLGLSDVPNSIPYTEIPVTIRRSIFVTNGTDTSASTFKATHALTMDSALNNIPEVNF